MLVTVLALRDPTTYAEQATGDETGERITPVSII